MTVDPFLTVYLICYFEITDTSLFNTDNIADFLQQVHYQRRNYILLLVFLHSIDLSVNISTANCLSCV